MRTDYSRSTNTSLAVRAVTIMAACVGLLVLVGHAVPDTLTWDADTGTTGAQDGSGTWSTTTYDNWWDGGANVFWNSTTPDAAIFGAGGAGSHTVILDVPITADRVTFGTGPTYTLSGDTLTLSGANRVTVDGQVTFDCEMDVVGSAWNKWGAGTLILTGPSYHSAYVNHADGVINIRHNNALGTGYEHVYGDGSLEVQDNITVANTLYIGNTSQADATVNFRSVSGDNEWTGVVYIHDTHAYAKVGVETGSTLTISGQIRPRNAAVGSLTKLGEGILVVSGNNTYVGPTYVEEGVLDIRHGNALGTTDAGTTVSTGAALDMQGGIGVGAEALTLTGSGVGGAGALRSTAGDNAWAGPVTLSGTVAVGVDADSLTFSGAIDGGALNKVGAGTLVLSGENSYTGQTTVFEGTLRLDGGDDRINPTTRIYVGDASVPAGATFDLNGQNQAFQNWSRVRSGSAVLLTDGAILTLYSADLWGGATISGTGGLVKEGSGVITFGTAATHTGGTVINDGRVAFYSGSNRLPTTGDVEVNGTGILHMAYYRYSNQTQTIDELSGDGTVWLSGVSFVIGNGDGSGEFSGAIENGPVNDARGDPYYGPGTLTKTGSGTITLSGNSSYTGATTVEEGTLEIGHANALGTADGGTTVSDGATLSVAGGITVAAEALDLAGYGVGSAGALRSTGGDNTWNGNLTMASGTRIGVDTGSTLTIGGTMTIAGWWRKEGGGHLVLTQANTQAGRVDVVGGILTLLDGDALGGISDYAHVGSEVTLELVGGITVPNGLYIGNTNPASTTLNLHSSSGDNTWAGYVRLHSGHPYGVIGVDAGSTLTISGQIEHQPGYTFDSTLTKLGGGTLIVTNANNTYTGPTYVDEGTLLVESTIASSQSITVAAGATLGGTGEVPTVDGAGLVSPGASPDILTAPSVDPSGGLDFAFEFGAAGNPDYGNATNSGTDVLRLTDLASPFSAEMTAANRVSVYLDIFDAQVGDVFLGGFYTDRGEDFLEVLDGASFEYYLTGDGGGSHPFGGNLYYTLGEWEHVPGFAVSSVAETANFGSGDVDGYVMQLTAVPEPATFVLLLLGLLPILLTGRRPGRR